MAKNYYYIDDSTVSGSLTMVQIANESSSFGIGATTNLELSGTNESVNISSTPLNGSANIDTSNGTFIYYTANATGNFTFNIRGNATTTLNSILPVGKCLTITILTTQGSSAYYTTSFSIDGVTVTPKWMNAIVPSSGYTNSINVYTYAIIKTADSTYTVVGSFNKAS